MSTIASLHRITRRYPAVKTATHVFQHQMTRLVKFALVSNGNLKISNKKNPAINL